MTRAPSSKSRFLSLFFSPLTHEPSVVADDSGGVDHGPAHVQVDVGVGGAHVVLVLGLHLAGLGAGLPGKERGRTNEY